jgi:ribonuclease Z
VNIGREKRIALVGPEGVIAAVGHKLAGYSWDLIDRYSADLVFDVAELVAPDHARTARFRFLAGFTREEDGERAILDDVVAEWAGLTLRAEILQHHGPSLGFALEEPAHVNIWPNRLAARGLGPGNWLQALKAAIRDGLPDAAPIALPDGTTVPLGDLRELASVTRGQKIAYVTDVADTPANRAGIAALAQSADTLFIEARFAAADADLARDRAHLTTRAAGEIARACAARRVEPFHFSPRYEGEEARLLAEVAAA